MPRWDDADWITENDTRDLASMARHILKADWVTPSPRPEPTEKCPPHQWEVGKILEPTKCRKCKVEKPIVPMFRGYEPHPNRDRERLRGDEVSLPLGLRSRQR